MPLLAGLHPTWQKFWLMVFPFLLLAASCARQAEVNPALDPASVQAQDTAGVIHSGSLATGVFTGADLIGEPQGRPTKQHESESSPKAKQNSFHNNMHSPNLDIGQDKQVPQQHKQNSNNKHYTCPMHPEVVRAQPGQCPKCGMDLEVKKSGQAGKGETR